MDTFPQKTLAREVAFSGVGIHTGQPVHVRFCPAPADYGLCFQRMDLPGQPIIPAQARFVCETSRSTMLGQRGSGVQTVEHVLAALSAYQIDNLCVQLSAAEPPVGDGSSLAFVEMIEEAVVVEQSAPRRVARVETPLFVSAGETHLVVLPSPTYRISYTLHYPQAPLIRSQYFSCEVTPSFFKEEIAPCRTFALYEEVAFLLEQGLIQGGTLENAVVVKEDVVLSRGGLRFPDEMVRHKVLDLIGDLALAGPFLGHVIAIRSGHTMNVALAKEIAQRVTAHTYGGFHVGSCA